MANSPSMLWVPAGASVGAGDTVIAATSAAATQPTKSRPHAQLFIKMGHVRRETVTLGPTPSLRLTGRRRETTMTGTTVMLECENTTRDACGDMRVQSS